MTVSTVTTNTFLSDTVILIRDDLRTNITDPISGARTGNEKFVMTSYPQREVKYPIITVQNTNIEIPQRLGMQSEIHLATLPLEIRVWARNVKERDELTQQVINRIRDNDLSGTVPANLLEPTITSAVNVDNAEGEASVRSRIIQVEYKFIIGTS